MRVKALLLVIDLQEGWRHKTATEPTMLRCVDLCKEFTGDVIHCCFRNKKDSLFETELNWFRFHEEEDIATISEAQELNLPVYWRSIYSCVTEEVANLVKQYERVYIAGVFTDASVYATAIDLFDMSTPVTVIRDCVATLHGEEVHRQVLNALINVLDRKNVIYSDELPAELLDENRLSQ